MDKNARQKSKEVIEARRKKMIEENSTSLALEKKGADTVLFGVEKENDGYRVAVYYVVDSVIVDKKVGASQLKHHAISIMEQYMSTFVIDSYNDPKAFFDTVVVH